MPFSTSSANALLELLLKATTWADVAEDDTTSPITNIYVALHTDTPGAAGTGSTNEIAYTDYARVAVARSTGFTVTTNTATNAGNITFPVCGASGDTATHWSLTTASSGASQVLCFGALNSSMVITTGATPQINAGDLDITAATS